MDFLANTGFNNMSNTILEIENVSKSFDGLHLFRETNLTIQRKTINSLFGSNGAGKTTFFNMIAGYIKPTSGRIYFYKEKVDKYNPSSIAYLGLGKMWQTPEVFQNHSVLENLLVSTKDHPGERILNYLFNRKAIYKKEKEARDRAYHIIDKIGLQGKGDQKAGSLSFGESKLLSIAMLIMNDAKLLLLDEPFSNVNPRTVEGISNTLIELKNLGHTIFMIEHKVKFAEAISDHCFMINNEQINLIT